MTRIHRTNSRILAIAPSTQGFGFAVLEGEAKLVDWGVKHVGGDKNEQAILKVAALMVYYLPAKLVVEDCSAEGCRRSKRIRTLIQETIKLAEQRRLTVVRLSREEVKRALSLDSPATKHSVAEFLARRFPEELASRLPPKRRAWKSEDGRMDIFDAVSLALAFFSSKKKLRGAPIS